MDNNCVFCKIINGDIPSNTLYEDEDFRVILDISPAVKGHAILIPKKHFTNIYEMGEDTASKVFLVVTKVARAIKEELNCEGLNVLQNNGTVAGQSVFHFHIHLIPRYKEDEVRFEWKENTYQDGEAVEIVDSIRKRLK